MINYKNKRNPVLPLEYHIPDSEGHVMPDGKLYVYGSYDDREDVFCSEKYYVASTSDMEHWTIYDESLNGKDIPWFNDPDAPKYPGIDWSHPTPFIQKMLAQAAAGGDDMKEKFEKAEDEEKPPLLFASDCVEKDGKYYLYFCMPDDSEGVAVSDRPGGPFVNPVQLPCGGIDPSVFIDDDGQAYFYWGQLFSHGVKLNPDMTSFDRNQIVDNLVTEEEHFFHEGSSMRKIGDTYYYVYADMERGKPTALGYSTGKSPLGPFTYRGIIVDNADCDPASWNNHGSIECVNGQWYVFYHRCSRGVQQHRRLCIEPITINPDGSIDEVLMTSQGTGEPFTPGETIMGYQSCGLKGNVYIGLDDQYGEKLMNISEGDEMIFRYVRSGRPYTKVKIEAYGSGAVEVLFINRQKTQASEKNPAEEKSAGVIRFSSGKQTDEEIRMPAGEYELKLRVLQTEDLEICTVTLLS